jgi:hypothetical protein
VTPAGGQRSDDAWARNFGRRARRILGELAFGMTTYEFARHALATRVAMENVFLLVVVGEMLGIPVMPPYYSLRLVPFVVPEIGTWKRRVLRERDFTEDHEFDLHGL